MPIWPIAGTLTPTIQTCRFEFLSDLTAAKRGMVMRTRFLFSVACGLLAMTASSLSANAEATKWSGPGYYIVGYRPDTDPHPGYLDFLAGPYSSEADCKAALSAMPGDERADATCNYYERDIFEN